MSRTHCSNPLPDNTDGMGWHVKKQQEKERKKASKSFSEALNSCSCVFVQTRDSRLRKLILSSEELFLSAFRKNVLRLFVLYCDFSLVNIIFTENMCHCLANPSFEVSSWVW